MRILIHCWCISTTSRYSQVHHDYSLKGLYRPYVMTAPSHSHPARNTLYYDTKLTNQNTCLNRGGNNCPHKV